MSYSVKLNPKTGALMWRKDGKLVKFADVPAEEQAKALAEMNGPTPEQVATAEPDPVTSGMHPVKASEEQEPSPEEMATEQRAKILQWLQDSYPDFEFVVGGSGLGIIVDGYEGGTNLTQRAIYYANDRISQDDIRKFMLRLNDYGMIATPPANKDSVQF